MAASRAICSVWWPMKLSLAHSVACLGSRFRGLCYQLWNLQAAKLCMPMCVCVRTYICVCVCVLALVHVCGLASRNSAETNALATQGWNFRPVFLYTRCWLWEARPEPTILVFFSFSLFFFSLFSCSYSWDSICGAQFLKL